MTPEGKIQRGAIAHARYLGLRTLRLALLPGVETGYPDTVIRKYPGLTLWLEIKKPGDKPRPIQWRRIRELRRDGFSAGYCDNLEDCRKVIDEFNETGEVAQWRG